MDVRIGIKDNARDISFQSGLSAKDLTAKVTKAIEAKEAVLELTDDKGSTATSACGCAQLLQGGGHKESHGRGRHQRDILRATCDR